MNSWQKIRGGDVILKSMVLRPLRRISPSSFHSLSQCMLRGVMAASGVGELLPSHPQAHFGTAAHHLIEKASKGLIPKVEEMEKYWQECVAEVEAGLLNSPHSRHQAPLSKSVTRYTVQKELLFKLAASLIPRTRSNSGSWQASAERWMETPDGAVGGYPDRIERLETSYRIIDYKTGSVQGENGIKPEYLSQLKLYAAIFYEVIGEWPISLEIHHISGERYTHNLSEVECIQLLKQARTLLSEINNVFENTDSLKEQQKKLASPSPDTCRYCKYRPACAPYWTKKEQSKHFPWPLDVRGSFVDAIPLGNGSTLLRLKRNHDLISIRGLLPERYQIVPGKEYVVYNLSDEKVLNWYSEGVLTTIYTF